jgi:hypothetical protein
LLLFGVYEDRQAARTAIAALLLGPPSGRGEKREVLAPIGESAEPTAASQVENAN